MFGCERVFGFAGGTLPSPQYEATIWSLQGAVFCTLLASTDRLDLQVSSEEENAKS
jgi:hypothetical protein